MAPIRVLQVFTIMNRGGAESMIMNYYRNIDRNQIQFDFLVHRKEKAAFDDEIERLGGKIYKLDPINPVSPAKYYEELRAFFKEHGDYAIVHSHLNTFSNFPLKIAKEFNIPCRIAHAHIAISDINLSNIRKEGLKETAKKWIKFRLKKRVKDNTTHLFSCGDKAGKWLFGKETSFRLMNNAIDSKKFAYNEDVARTYRNTLNIKEDTLVLGHVGRYASQKNHAFLIDIFAAVLKKNQNCVLISVGDGPLRAGIEQKAKTLGIEDKILFLGVREDIPALFQVFDVFVFPSFYEGLPVTLIEAQAAGVKVVASDTITSEVHVTDEITFLPLQKEADIWAKTILEIDTSKKGQNTDKIVDANYDIVSNTLAMEKFYLEQSAM